MVWQFSGADLEREQGALELTSRSFFVFAAWVAGQAVWDLLAGSEPAEPVPGIVLAALSLTVIRCLAAAVLFGASALLGQRVAASPGLLGHSRTTPLSPVHGRLALRPNVGVSSRAAHRV